MNANACSMKRDVFLRGMFVAIEAAGAGVCRLQLVGAAAGAVVRRSVANIRWRWSKR